jgi:hypothetical protein
MNTKSIICEGLYAAVLTVGFAFLSPSYGDERPLVYYWQPDGTISDQSKDNAKDMRELAKEHGYVTLWLVLNYPFNVYFEDMSPEEIAEQSAHVAQGFQEVLAPLIATGDVWHRTEGPYIRGPGIAVRATDKGLRSLLGDTRIRQITAARE